jgi:fungal type III polyketide synthase
MSMNLLESASVATKDIYKSRGNTSSVAVLAVLDRLQTFEVGKQGIIACSFGPGPTVEMAPLKLFL